MDLVFKARPFHPDELRILKTLKTQREKQGAGKLKYHHCLAAAPVGALFAYLTVLAGDTFWCLFPGFAAVFSFSVVVFGPWEVYKFKRDHKKFLQKLTSVLDQGTANTSVIHATRMAVAEEYEDEGDLFIIEYAADRILYFWDHDYNLRKKFPCLSFEIYEEEFFKLFGRQVYPLSERIEPVVIDRKAKWKYMKEVGAQGHLYVEQNSFDKVVEAYNSFG